MKLVVGLGNVGQSYQMTRHNIGFMVLDALSEDSWKNSHFSFIQKISIEKKAVLLAKPQTQMNLSGRAVSELVRYYRIENKNLLVVHDDVDLDFLKMKFQTQRGSGGHKGVQNIHDQLKANDYYRLKIGIGRVQDTHHHVLSPFNKEELAPLQDLIAQVCSAVKYFVAHGGVKAGNLYNQKTERI